LAVPIVEQFGVDCVFVRYFSSPFNIIYNIL
jgi:hypothetical protein